ncbi:MAG: nickel pincer cofactor biosynthesis protein LarC [Thermodesulfovibrionales bacterium]
MNTIAYIDCFSGISGDMLLGALVDSGVPLEYIKETIDAVPIDGYEISERKVSRCGIQATKIDVDVHRHIRHHVRWGDIFNLLDSAKIPDKVKTKALNIFRAIFSAEAKVHGCAMEDVHLHELGGIDCIVDIVGGVSGLYYLGIDEVYVSDINLGSGMVKTSHGMLPVPAPATIELLKGFRSYKSEIQHELTTPTGAAILRNIARQTDTLTFKPLSIGYGAGTRDIQQQPNVLRLVLGESEDIRTDESIYVVEANIDDMTPQYFEHAMDTLLESGAKDVYLQQIVMKKSRPAIKITVLTNLQRLQSICDILFRHTTTIGLRFYKAYRQVLNRELNTLHTDFGEIRIKTVRDKDDSKRHIIEYNDLLAASKAHSLPLFVVESHVREILSKMRDQD